ncbi:MAG: EF-hand domain-containing protein, partial [Actinomycetota bacterium]|nr:EF-hand domain-containing protein [Actinomycetota bacterium]
DMFREWDADGNGAVDKKEFRKAIKALGYEAKKKDIDQLFDDLDDVKDGFIEYGELKQALSNYSKRNAKVSMPKGKGRNGGGIEAADGDVAGTGEEAFETGMKQNAMEYDAADTDQDNKLDFGEFCAFVRDREEGDFTDRELRERFDALDIDKSGKVDLSEYLQWSLKDALARSSERVVDLFKKWDEDKSGSVDKREFTRAVRALGFGHISDADAGKVFDSLDADRSGKLEYKELNEMLRKGFGSEAAKRNLKRGQTRDDGRGAALTAKNLNKNYDGARVAVFDETVKLDASSGVSVVDQLNKILLDNSVKLIDMFREWDADGNGAVDKKEFRKAIKALGYEAKKKDIDQLFDDL